MKKRKDILRSDSRGVIPTAKGYCLLDAGFFYQMTRIIESNETDVVDCSLEERFFRPLTPEIIVDQLREMRLRWYNFEEREFDIEDQFENWLMAKLISAIEQGGLTLK
jgi:hypothetical protein